MRFFITFACYGARLHGDESGSVDRHHNLPGSRLLGSDPQRASSERQRMAQLPYWLDREGRSAVLSALRGHCVQRGWSLLAAHVRTNHVHAIVEAGVLSRKSATRESHERIQVVRQPGAQPLGPRWTGSKAMGTPWKHTLVMEGRGSPKSAPVRCRGAGRTHGSLYCRNAIKVSAPSRSRLGIKL